MKKAILITLCVGFGWFIGSTLFASPEDELPELNPDDYKELLSTTNPAHCDQCENLNGNTRSHFSR